MKRRRSLVYDDFDVMETGRAAAFHSGTGNHNLFCPCWSAGGVSAGQSKQGFLGYGPPETTPC